MDLVRNILDRASRATQPVGGFKGLLADNKITLKNLLFSALLVSLELLLSSGVFDCPLEHHQAYGTTFLLAPVLVAFIANVLLIANIWKLSDRIFVRRYYRRCDSCWVLPKLIRALVGPAVWLVTSLVDTTYYKCAAVGPSIETRNLTNTTEIEELEAKFAIAKSMSHIWAWIVLLVTVIVTAVVIASKKCCLKDDVLMDDDYVLERREAVGALLLFRFFIDHPDETAVFLNEEESLISDSTVTDRLNHALGNPATEVDSAGDNNEENASNKNETTEAIKGRFVGGEEEIEIYENGIPERCGRKWVVDLFKRLSEEDDRWNYDKAFSEFSERYPRVTSGRPRDEWVARKNPTKPKAADDGVDVDGKQTERQTTRGEYSKLRKAEPQNISVV